MNPRQARKSRLPGLGARSETGISRTLVGPGQLLLLFLIVFPAGVATYISFTAWAPTSGHIWYQAYKDWNSWWLNNFWEALSGGSFWSAIWRTVIVTVVGVSCEFLLGFLLALLFLREFRGRNLLTVIFLLPMMVVPAVAGLIFFMLFQTEGPVNAALTAVLSDFLHLTGPIHIGWLSDPGIALWSVILADIWQWTPLMFLILLSGLVALPDDQMNQARILGASFAQQFRYLILPMMWPIILIALVIRSIEIFKIFDSAWLLTQGGPGDATTTISVYLYRETFINARWGYASAVAIIVLILVSAAAMVAVRPIEAAQEETMQEIMGQDENLAGAGQGEAEAVA
jgi:multiple sugar transport system permease protein